MLKHKTHVYFPYFHFLSFYDTIRLNKTGFTMKKIFKKLLVVCGIIAVVSATIDLLMPTQTYAADPNTSHRLGDCNGILGLVPWDCKVNITDENTLKSGIWQIAVNIATDITVIAAYLIIGYVIYGGYLYIFSGGDTGKVATGKKAITQAFIGLAIVMSANIIMTGVRVALVGDDGNISNCATDTGCVTPGEMITNAIHWVIGIAGVVSLIFVVYGGISYTISAGDPDKVKKAKNMIIYALIGLAIVGLAEAITAFVSNRIRQANEDALNYINQTTISKEVYENKIN